MKQNVKKEIGKLSFLLLTIHILVVIYFVLFSDRLGRTDTFNDYRYNLTLFNEIRRFILYRDQVSPETFVLNLIGNLMVFFPIGFLIPIWRQKKTGVVRIVVYAFLLSLGIELLQLISRVGVFDVDDLFLNITGAVLGFEIYQILEFILYHMKARKVETDQKVRIEDPGGIDAGKMEDPAEIDEKKKQSPGDKERNE